MGKPRRSFTPEFKQEDVDLCRRTGKSECQAARELHLPVTLRAVLRYYVVDFGGPGEGRTCGPLIKRDRRSMIRTARCCEGFPVNR